ncbi:hypothetical protein T440DRAFT_520366 [Plenodomus tracheiphilus IPT5]|uniref:Rhodopsin domain-containing protein n=1 Tax=Plenodomus tracheiphilus IPT5 TaxID=1408161 RepID=A0A6A7B0R1_9PLEO|nr:hypothetical protein T440DRAFT_520366 [Plenodomus tracheiphilus IPT5]
MAGTLQPIAALTVEDHGPINTVVAIFLTTTSVLITTVRVAIRKQKVRQFEPDDILFGLGLCFGILSSVLSHFCVRAGLGRHQQKLDQELVGRYFKLFWVTQIFVVLALALAKLSLALLFKRITPRQIRPRIARLLMPMIALYTLVCVSLISFQCQLPRPWILSPKKCYTHGNVYYPITISNILTDALLSIWMFPIIRTLHTRDHTKAVLMWLFGSRLFICILDVGRMVVIHNALQSEDQTRSQLLWAVMDQIVVHLSINHATLPRIQNFLSHLQMGPINIFTVRGDTSASRAKVDAAAGQVQAQQRAAAHTNESQSSSSRQGKPFYKAFSALYSSLAGPLRRASSISEQPLKEQPGQGIELQPRAVYTGKNNMEESNARNSQSAATSFSSDVSDRDDSTTQIGVVRVQHEIRLTYEKA